MPGLVIPFFDGISAVRSRCRLFGLIQHRQVIQPVARRGEARRNRSIVTLRHSMPAVVGIKSGVQPLVPEPSAAFNFDLPLVAVST
jgi:hypothetical protein